MNLRRQLHERLNRARDRAEQVITGTVERAEDVARQTLNRFTGVSESDQRAISQFVRPDFGGTQLPARTLLEPVIAVTAALALAATAGLGLVSFAGMLIAGWIIYAILTHVFGLELDIAIPGL